MVLAVLFGTKYISSVSRERNLMWGLTICVAMLLGGFTIARNYVYRSETALWEDTVKKSPNKARVYNNLGYAYYLEGRRKDARDAYLRALELDPGFQLARNNLNMLDQP